MNEAYLKGRLMKALRAEMPTGVGTRHEDKFHGGTPDLSWAWMITSWTEVKYWRRGRPSRLTALQADRLRDLRRAGVPAYCLTYYEAGHDLQKRVVLDDGEGARGTLGFDHRWIAHTLREDHERLALRDVEKVRAFHLKFGLDAPTSPRFDRETLEKRLRHIREEADELEVAIAAGDLAAVADALVDVAYVTYGAAINQGLPWQELFDDVHRANLAKVRVDPEPGSHKFGIVKPEGWTPPDSRGILKTHGHPPQLKEAA